MSRPFLPLLALLGACGGTPVTYVVDGGGSMHLSLAPTGEAGVRFEAEREGITRQALMRDPEATPVACEAPALWSGTYGDEEMVPTLTFCADDVPVEGAGCFDHGRVTLDMDDSWVQISIDHLEGTTPDDLLIFLGDAPDDTDYRKQGSRVVTFETYDDCLGDDLVPHELRIDWAFDMHYEESETIRDEWGPPTWYEL
ncbi:MAG: hypothetical protein R3F59_27490 [Myxococcota bacterium]